MKKLDAIADIDKLSKLSPGQILKSAKIKNGRILSGAEVKHLDAVKKNSSSEVANALEKMANTVNRGKKAKVVNKPQPGNRSARSQRSKVKTVKIKPSKNILKSFFNQ